MAKMKRDPSMGSEEIARMRRSAANTLRQARAVVKSGGQVVDKGINKPGSTVRTVKGTAFANEIQTRAVERAERVDEITKGLSKGQKFSNPRTKLPGGMFTMMEFINTQAGKAAGERTPGIQYGKGKRRKA